MWQILVEPEFAEKYVSDISVDYFDDPNLKRLYLIILEYHKEYGKVPNLQNNSIYQAINAYKSPNNTIEEESLNAIIQRIKLWNERVLNKDLMYDGDVVQKSTTIFIKQQEFRKLGEFIINNTKTGGMKDNKVLGVIEEKIQKISRIGDDEDYGTEVIDSIENALRKEFRQTIPTGIEVIDALTGGGLGRSEIGLILSPSGIGKSTILSKIANTAYELDYNVLQVIFEDTEDQIKRKHYAIWSKVPMSKFDENNELVIERVKNRISEVNSRGKLIIKRFSQDNTTLLDIKHWILRYQKKYGFKFDMVVLDYLDCVETHKKAFDKNDSDLIIIKGFEAMAGELEIPMWSATQGNRESFNSEIVEVHQTGGSIKKVQKAHFFMSIAKTADQKESNLATMKIIKARFASDGQIFRDCIFNNDTMEIKIIDDKYRGLKYNKVKKYGEDEINKLEKIIDIHAKISENVLDKSSKISDFVDMDENTMKEKIQQELDELENREKKEKEIEKLINKNDDVSDENKKFLDDLLKEIDNE
jgi:replicative DNA helicase